MKKISILFFLFFLTSCFWWNSEVAENIQTTQEQTQTNSLDTTQTDSEEISSTGDTTKAYSTIENLDENNFISLTPLDVEKLIGDEIQIFWKTLSSDIDKIEVSFQNRDSSFPADTYTLKTFKAWDTDFHYIASAWFRVLDFWLNEYIFTAYRGTEKSQIKLSIFLPQGESQTPAEIEIEGTGQTTDEDILSILPTWWEFWDVVLKADGFTYPDIKNLEIQKEELLAFLCSESDTISQYLVGNYSWVYWNTCREIVNTKWVSINVLRLEGEKYFYEKHFLDPTHELHGIFLLETGTWVTKENLADKNKELKGKEYSTSLVDSLFKKIIQ